MLLWREARAAVRAACSAAFSAALSAFAVGCFGTRDSGGDLFETCLSGACGSAGVCDDGAGFCGKAAAVGVGIRDGLRECGSDLDGFGCLEGTILESVGVMAVQRMAMVQQLSNALLHR